MALQIWLPLTGNVQNQGVADVTFTAGANSIWNQTGRLGACYEWPNLTNSFLKANSTTWMNELTNNTFSLCMWVRRSIPDETNNVYENYFYAGTGGTSWVNYSVSLMCMKDAHDIRIYLSNGTGTAALASGFIPPADEWHHYAATYNGSTLSLYIDGVLKKTVATTLVINWSQVAHINIGGAGGGNAERALGCTQDVRFYDNCLSASEVKHISQALAIHYLLNNNGYGVYNLLPDLSTWPSEGGVTKTQEPNSMWYKVATTKTSSRWGSYLNLTVEPDTTYTFSIDVKKGGKGAGIGLQVSNAAITGWPAGSVYNSTTTVHYTKTFTTTSDQTFCKIYLYHSPGEVTEENYAYYARPKLEKGSHDTLYSIQETLIEDINIIYDISGYNHNGIKNGILPITSPSPRYQSCMYFPAVLNTTYIKVPFADVNKDRFYTFNVWFNKDKQSTCPWDTIFGAGSGYELEMRTTAAAGGLNKIYLYSWGSKAMGTDEYTLNEWHMLTFCQDTAHTYVYLDGQLLGTGNSKDPVAGQYYLAAWSSRQNYQGYLSDMRIYCTCLSADDVQELYQTSMAIDSNGNIIPRVLS